MDEKQIAKPFETELPYKLMAEEHFWRMRLNGWMAEWSKKIIPWSPEGKTESPGASPVLATSYYSYGCF